MAAYIGPHLAEGKHLTAQIEVETFVSLRETRVIADDEWKGSGYFQTQAILPDQ